MIPEAQRLDHLDRAGRATGALARQPRLLVYVLVAAAVLLSWLLLATIAVRDMAARLADAPGGWLLLGLPEFPLPALLERFVALCLGPAPASGADPAAFVATVAMWFLMAVAMMLPSAAPMLRTYCEIADTARAKGEDAVHPAVLLAGYLTSWSAGAVIFASATVCLQALSGERPLDPLAGIAGSAALAIAGLYQFSSFRDACLKKCRNPFGILFSRWTTRPAGMFRLGVEQGVWCVGCCWALMLVMFVVGIMNVFWMALLAMFTLVEKQARGPVVTRAAGAILLVWSAALLVVSTGTA